MKNLNNIFLIFFILFTITLTGQDRNVYWVHGLGSGDGTWDAMEQMFDRERQMNNDATGVQNNSRGYQSMTGINNSTNDVIGDIQTTYGPAGSRNPRNIGVGHSMGGVVLRNIDGTQVGNNRRFGGIITIGSPNDGAAIANALNNGEIADAATLACARLGLGPGAQGGILSAITLGRVGVLCGAVELLGDGFLERRNSQAARDLQVRSGVMNTISARPSNIPHISIWGNENSPVHWRLLSSFQGQGNNDMQWVNTANTIRTVYSAAFYFNLAAATATAIVGFWNPTAWNVSAKYAVTAFAWREGVQWFDNSEAMWNGLIDCGSTRTMTVATYNGFNINCNTLGYTGSAAWIDCVNEYCNPYPVNCYVPGQNFSIAVVLNGQSDGFICRDSQILNGLANRDIYEARFVNHSEETRRGNDVERHLRGIWNGDTRPNFDFFITETR